MDIEIYDTIKSKLQDFLHSNEYIKSFMKSKTYDFVVGYEPSTPKYPYVKFSEIRNNPNPQFRGRLETVADLGYKVDIYAKTINKSSKQDIARKIMKLVSDYLTCIGLRQVSMNIVENDGMNGDLYHIIIMYSADYFEQRKMLI